MRRGRPRLRAVGGVAALAVLATLALGRGQGGSAAASPEDPPAPPPPPPWKAKPADVVVLISGRERGLLEPCGCFFPQRGGLARRATLWEQAKAAAKASVALSLGETLAEWNPVQNDLKAELFRASLAAMGYAGSLLSPFDLSPGWPALSQPYGTPAETPRPPLNAKLKAGGALATSASVDPILRTTAGDLKVRAVSVADPSIREEWVGLGFADAVIDPATALEALPKEPGLLVVAAHSYRESLAMIVHAAADRADVVVVVDMAGEVALGTPREGWKFEKPLFVKFDEKGKEAGLVRLHRAGTGWTADYEAVPLDPEFDQGESKAHAAVDALFAAYRGRLQKARLLETDGLFMTEGPAKFVGNAACAACHEAIAESWKQTPHANALQTLVGKESAWDPECVRCHTVGWYAGDLLKNWTRAPSSFRDPDSTPALGGVGCESCHGPGSLHAKEPDRKDLFAVWRTETAPRSSVYVGMKDAGRMWRDFGRDGCAKCHDPDNSRDFNQPGGYEKYRPVVDHRDVPKEKRTVRK